MLDCACALVALIEIKITVAYLLPRFDFLNKAEDDEDYKVTLVMSMASGFPVGVRVEN
jgi:cytochrome P450